MRKRIQNYFENYQQIKSLTVQFNRKEAIPDK